jgi:transposase
VQDGRVLVLTRLIAGKVEPSEAALLLGLSLRSIRRLRARYLEQGPATLAHGNRGRRPAHALDAALAQRVVRLAKTTYAGCNDSHLAELLSEREGITLSRATVQRVLRRAGVKSPRRHRATRYRSRRDRRAAAGMLLQLDGSRARWFGSERAFATLHAAIDDATGEVVAATFREQEDGAGYLELLQQILRRGVPLAVYSDRHGIFRRDGRVRDSVDEELSGEREPTQLGRAFGELGIEMIFANSPQAKGRIERLFGTLQDRLTSELRLAEVTTIEAANRFLLTYLPRHNARFQVAPAEARAAWRALPQGKTPESVCCLKYRRIVAADNTVRFEGLTLQLPPRAQHWSWSGQRVELRHHLDGSFSVHAPSGIELVRSDVPTTPPTLRAKPFPRAPIPGVSPLPVRGANSPWRKHKSLSDWHPAAARRTIAAARQSGRAL